MINRTAGYTLVETVIIVGLVAMLFLALFTLFVTASRTFSHEQRAAGAAYEARTTIREIQIVARAAHSVVDSVVINTTTYTTDMNSTLVLALPAINTLYDVIPSAYDHVVFSLSGSELTKIVSPHAASARAPIDKTLSKLVADLTFAYDSPTPSDARSIDVTIITEASTQLGTKSYTLVGRAHMRN